MRTIKFRAWFSGCLFPFDPTDLEDYEKPQMIYNVQDLYDGKGCGNKSSVLGGRSSFGSLLEDELFTIMQFTGLHDKNGKMIYDGDIVSFEDDPADIVEWSEDFAGWGFKTLDRLQPDEFLEWGALRKDHEKHYIVAGNIYENPELLNQN